MSPKLVGCVALVTGASRGIGRGIALQLGEAGATVYLTGRKAADLEKTCKEVQGRGGNAISVVMDHGNDTDVENLFERIKKEQHGKLDICVNNAYAGVNAIMRSAGKKFYDTEPQIWDEINGVGLRGHYLCTVFASRIMVTRQSGLIVNVSSPGGLKYLFNVSYGVGKAACDRMAADCAVELKKKNVTMISLWPGAVKTEAVAESLETASEKEKKVWEDPETVEFAGKAIVNLAADQDVIKKTGRVLLTADLAGEYGFVDEDGLVHSDIRSLKGLMRATGHSTIAMLIPEFVRVPLFMLHFASFKF
jgi:dehydrogenase/reductase SDR family protein 1